MCKTVHAEARMKLAAEWLWAVIMMLRVRLATTAHAQMEGSTCLSSYDNKNGDAHSTWCQYKTGQKACKMEYLLQAIKEAMLHCVLGAPQHANIVFLLPCNTQILAGRLTVLAMFCPLKDCSFLRAMAATASSSLSCTTSSLLKPHTVLLRACEHTHHLSRSQSYQACQRPNIVYTVLLEEKNTFQRQHQKTFGEVKPECSSCLLVLSQALICQCKCAGVLAWLKTHRMCHGHDSQESVPAE
jgi:hypothetical protein